MKKSILILLALLSIKLTFAQVMQEWVAFYDGSAQAFDHPTSMALDDNGNVYVTGESFNIGNNRDYATVKYNSAGVQQWAAIYNGPGNNEDYAVAIVVDTSGNVYVTGYSYGSGTYMDYATIKYNSSGVEQWVARYNSGEGILDDRAVAIALDAVGNVYVSGNSPGNGTGFDYTTIKYNSSGAEQWVRRYNRTGSPFNAEQATSMTVDAAGNVYVTGKSNFSSNYYDYATIKYNTAGDQQWVAIYHAPGNLNYSGIANAITLDDAGNVYVTGESQFSSYNNDYVTIKYNSSGTEQWVAIYNGPENNADYAKSIAVDGSGNVYVTGYSYESPNYDYATVKYNYSGLLEWSIRYDGPINGSDVATSLTLDEEGNVYVTGESAGSGIGLDANDYAAIKYNSSGVEQWVERYNGNGNQRDFAVSVVIDAADNVYVTGESFTSSTNRDFATIKYSQKPRYPVLIVPGIAGTYAANVENDLAWLVERGTHPNNIQVDPLAGVYDSLIKTLENVGYEKDKDLFVVNYDWRLLPAPIDNNFDSYIDGITGTSITDDEFKYGVDYLGWYVKKACDRWRTDYNEELDSIDIISHSTGGLVTRSYIQSSAYGGIYDDANNYKLAKIRNFIMIGVPNRGASKAWNPLHDNWISDVAYRFVLSKIINRAFQKLKRGYIITGPDYYITWASILDSLGNPNKELLINKYVPTIRGLLATFDFIDFGNGLTNVNNDPLERNSLILDLNNGYDLYPNADPNHFLDSTSVKVLYGTSNETLDYVEQRDDPEFNALQSFTDWTRSSALGGTIWYKDLASGQNTGDGTVPTISAVGQFLNDNRAAKFAFTVSNHTGMVSTLEVQSNILNILNVNYDQENIAIGSSENVSNILNIISDPVELFVTDGVGRRLGYSNSTGRVTEIPNSSWFGNTEGMGYVFGSVIEPINLQLTGLGEDYYAMVSVEDSGNGGGVVLEGFLAMGEVINYQITLDPLSVNQIKALTPESLELAQNYPNPFNPITIIQYSIPQRSNVTLKVYDVLGNEIATLVNEEKERGVYTVNFNASNMASGIYIYRITAGSFVETKKMILIK